jgi:c(7)-type cytochrome triheme protein
MAKWNIAAVILTALLMPAVAMGAIGNIKLDDKMHSMNKAGVGPVIFPHDKHEKIYKCGECHPKIFKDKHGANDISMKFNMEGKFCGSPNCHNSMKAFPLDRCTNCHTNVRAVK